MAALGMPLPFVADASKKPLPSGHQEAEHGDGEGGRRSKCCGADMCKPVELQQSLRVAMKNWIKKRITCKNRDGADVGGHWDMLTKNRAVKKVSWQLSLLTLLHKLRGGFGYLANQVKKGVSTENTLLFLL